MNNLTTIYAVQKTGSKYLSSIAIFLILSIFIIAILNDAITLIIFLCKRKTIKSKESKKLKIMETGMKHFNFDKSTFKKIRKYDLMNLRRLKKLTRN